MKKSSSTLLEPLEVKEISTVRRPAARRRGAPSESTESYENGGSEPKHLNGNREVIIPCEQLDMNAILVALASLKKGDFSVRLPVTFTNTEGKVADVFNDV